MSVAIYPCQNAITVKGIRCRRVNNRQGSSENRVTVIRDDKESSASPGGALTSQKVDLIIAIQICSPIQVDIWIGELLSRCASGIDATLCEDMGLAQRCSHD